MGKEHKIYLLLGSNEGDKLQNLETARSLLESEVGRITSKSRIYETQPWGFTEQENFFNQAVELKSILEPTEVLAKINAIENRMGRLRSEKWGPRVIDIDLLFFDDLILETESLKLPHPRIPERNFVLVPLIEIAAELVHPIHNQTIEELYWDSKDTMEVILTT